jgi:predicted metal-dependent peptidase
MLFGTLSAKDKLIRARVQIQNSNPFFAFMSLYLKFFEDEKLSARKTKDGKETFLAGVDIEGNFYYNKKSIEELPDNELQGLVIHEILHLAFLHLSRRGTRDFELFNIAADIVCNNIIVNNNYALPKNGIIPYNNTVELKDEKGKCFCKITDINKKTVEQVYDELMKHVKVINVQMTKAKNGKGNTGFGFDLHIEGAGGKDLTKKEKEKLEKEWLTRVADATNSAKMRGNMPAGMELLLGQLHTQKVDWKHMLKQYIQSQIPYDYTYSRPNKKSICSGFYIPDCLKEKIDVLVTIDTSGSIGQKELTDFLSEIVGMAKGFKDKINMVLLTHDTEVQNDEKIENGNIAKIMKIKIKGGGGTSHGPIFDYIKKKYKKTKLAICFTDGYSDFDEIKWANYSNFKKLFVISSGGTTEGIPPYIPKIDLGKFQYD